MVLVYQRFRDATYAEYASWFADPDLNRWLGPMDADWLHAVLSELESEGVTWAVFQGSELVAVVETRFDPHDRCAAYLRGLAIRPSLRGQGMGTAVVCQLLDCHAGQGITGHTTFISVHNAGSIRFFERLGFVRSSAPPNAHGYAAWIQRKDEDRPIGS